MKRLSLFMLCLLMLITALAGCAPAAQNGSAAPQPEKNQPTAASNQGASGSGGDELVITLDSAGKTIDMKNGQKIMVKLGEDYNWEIDVTPDLIVGQVKDATLDKGVQGVYQAKMVGKAVIQATGKPACAKDNPPCTKGNQQFTVNLTVSNP